MRRTEITIKQGSRGGELPNHAFPTATATSLIAIPVDGLYIIDATAGLTGDLEVRPGRKVRVVDFWVVKTGGAGGAGDTFTLKNNTTAISDALDVNVADKTVVRAGTIDDASWEVDPNAATPEDLVVTGASGAAGVCFIKVVPVA
jgi:hypothetical protein